MDEMDARLFCAAFYIILLLIYKIDAATLEPTKLQETDRVRAISSFLLCDEWASFRETR